jgi:hypothetical protein
MQLFLQIIFTIFKRIRMVIVNRFHNNTYILIIILMVNKLYCTKVDSSCDLVKKSEKKIKKNIIKNMMNNT